MLDAKGEDKVETGRVIHHHHRHRHPARTRSRTRRPRRRRVVVAHPAPVAVTVAAIAAHLPQTKPRLSRPKSRRRGKNPKMPIQEQMIVDPPNIVKGPDDLQVLHDDDAIHRHLVEIVVAVAVGQKVLIEK